MRTLAVTGLLLATLLGGCLADSTDSSEDAPNVSTWQSMPVVVDGKVEQAVPVPVFVLGFPENVAQDLAQKLLAAPELRSGNALVPQPMPVVITPTAAWQANFDAFLATAVVAGHGADTGYAGAILDGTAIEAYLQANLDALHPVPAGLNRLVVMDTGHRNHAYHYTGDVGWREPVRAFGEHSSLLVWDPHADVDPWVGQTPAIHAPVAGASASHIAQWVEHAIAIRALQMPIWPPTTLGCHAITVVLAVRNTAITPTVLGLQSWDETLNLPALEATYENLTGDEVHVDVKVLQLPVDDPALDAITRENSARTITQNYLSLNFDDYHVAHEGCEPYLSLVVFGDLVDQRTQSNGNAVMLANGHRISTSLVAENVRIFSEAIGYNQVWDESTTFERVGPGADPHAWFTWVVAHETGHLFSLPHPNYSTGSQSFSDPGFASTWNVMGYQMRRIVTETSLVDTNNFARNQAAYAVLENVDHPDLDAALTAMGEYRWKDATRILIA